MRLGISTRITQPHLRGAAPPVEEEEEDDGRVSLTLNATVASDDSGDLKVDIYGETEEEYYTINFPLHFYINPSAGAATADDPFIRNASLLIDAHYDITLNFPANKKYGSNVLFAGLIFPSVRMMLDGTTWTDDALDNLVITINNYGSIVGTGGWGGTGGRVNKVSVGGGGGGGGGIHPTPSTTTSVSNGGDGTTAKPYGTYGVAWYGAGGAGAASTTVIGGAGVHGTTTAGGAGGAAAATSGVGVTQNAEAGGFGGGPFWYDFKDGLTHEQQPSVTIINHSSGIIKSGGGGGGGSQANPSSGGAAGDPGYAGSAGTGTGGQAGGATSTFRVTLPFSPSQTTPRDWTITNNGATGSIRTSDLVS